MAQRENITGTIAKILHQHHSTAWMDLEATESPADEGRVVEIEMLVIDLAQQLFPDANEQRGFIRAATTSHVVLESTKKARH